MDSIKLNPLGQLFYFIGILFAISMIGSFIYFYQRPCIRAETRVVYDTVQVKVIDMGKIEMEPEDSVVKIRMVKGDYIKGDKIVNNKH